MQLGCEALLVCAAIWLKSARVNLNRLHCALLSWHAPLAMTTKQAATGSLYVVATPIGNLSDMVPRAVEILQQVDCIVCEDTRHSRRLLDHFHISKPLLSLHEHNEDTVMSALLSRLQGGETLALISDAGTPLISDPGYALVRAARINHIQVVPIPGPSAVITALAAAGLPSDRFVFEGFLPAKAGQRLQRLQSLCRESRTLIFYEAPHRVQASLMDMVTAFGAEREAVIARELTKAHETIRLLPLQDLHQFVATDPNQQKGEIVLLVRGYQAKIKQAIDTDTESVLRLLAEHLPPKKAANLTAKITGVDKKRLYEFITQTKSS